MSKKWAIGGVGGIVCAICVVLVLTFLGTSHTVSVSETMAQMALDYEIPRLQEKHGIKITHMSVHFDNAAEVLIELTGHEIGKHFTMVISAAGQPDITHSHYGELHFQPDRVKIQEFTYSGTPPGEMLKHAADRYLIKHPGMQNAVNDVAPYAEAWMTTLAETSAVAVFNQVPIYKLKDDWKGTLLGASVSKAVVHDDHLEITFSLWALTLKVIIFLVVGVLSMLVVIGLFVLEAV